MTKKKEIEKLANDRGFTKWAIINNTIYQFMDNTGINLWVDTTNNHFKMAYLIPKSNFKLVCPDCSPFTNDEYFKKLYRKFRKEVVECWGHLM